MQRILGFRGAVTVLLVVGERARLETDEVDPLDGGGGGLGVHAEKDGREGKIGLGCWRV